MAAATPKLIVNLTRGNVACERVLIADTALPRMRGLLGRRSLTPGDGVLLQPAPSIHTAFMRFEFDAVFLDGSLRVVRAVERLKPWRAVAARHAQSVLELAAGEVARRGIEVGDQIVVSDPEPEMVPDDRPQGARDDLPGPALDESEPSIWDARIGLTDAPAPQLAVGPRVLLVGRDRRFRSVAAALLHGRGYSVSVAERIAGLSDLAARDRIDVVVIDAGDQPRLAALEAARLEALHPSVGFVLVSDGAAHDLPAAPVVPKWGSFEALYDAIEIVRSHRAQTTDR
jgi:uncharacterized protein